MTFGGVVYMHDMSLDRYFDTSQGHLRTLNLLCREATLDRVVFVTSKWSRQGDRNFAKLEAELKDTHWKGMLQREDGASVMRLDPRRPNGGEYASAWAVVSRILQQVDHRLNRDAPNKPEAPKPSAVSMKNRKSARPKELAKLVREQRGEESRIQEELITLDASITEGDAEARARIEQKEEELRAMQEAIHRTRASLFTRLASRFRRMRRSHRTSVMKSSRL